MGPLFWPTCTYNYCIASCDCVPLLQPYRWLSTVWWSPSASLRPLALFTVAPSTRCSERRCRSSTRRLSDEFSTTSVRISTRQTPRCRSTSSSGSSPSPRFCPPSSPSLSPSRSSSPSFCQYSPLTGSFR